MDQNNQNPTAQQPAAAPQTPTVEDIQKKLNEQLSEAMQTSPSGISASPQPTAQPAVQPTPTPTESVVPPVVEPTSAPEPTPTPAPEPIQEPTPMPVVPAPEAAPAGGTSVIMYTIENCPFCKAEKEYLAKEGMQFTEKRVDANEADLKEMLELSDNFAGVPVTLIKTGDRQRVIKGFTQADFEQELVNLGLKQGTPTPVQAAEPTPTPPVAEPEPMQPQPAVEAPMPAEPAGAMSQSVK